jgi:catechol 2,3-dioxygenase-like lactoylglutathione lyase family enzyme
MISVAHFSIPVSDIEKSTRFSTDVLGCGHPSEAAL